MDRALFRCRVHIRCRVARNVERCCRRCPNRSGNVQNASSNSTPADSAPISILRAVSNARSLSPSGSRARTSAINVRFIPRGFEWKRKRRRRVRRDRWMHERRLRISSRSRIRVARTLSSAFLETAHARLCWHRLAGGGARATPATMASESAAAESR